MLGQVKKREYSGNEPECTCQAPQVPKVIQNLLIMSERATPRGCREKSCETLFEMTTGDPVGVRPHKGMKRGHAVDSKRFAVGMRVLVRRKTLGAPVGLTQGGVGKKGALYEEPFFCGF